MATEHSSSHATKTMRALETENEILKARLYNTRCENEDYKRQMAEIRKELKETQALLGQGVVAESLNKRQDGLSITKKRRSRSPSLEIIETPVLFKKEEPLVASAIKLEGSSSQQPIVEVNNRAKRRKLNLASVPSSLEFHNREPKVFRLSPSDVGTYLHSLTPLEINPLPLNVEVSRAFLRIVYGGCDRTFLQYLPSDRNPSRCSRRQLVFPMLSLNPAMPSSPGMPGLVFASRHEILENSPWTVFCKRSNAAPAVWLYLGEYENTLAGVMTPEQFRSQALQVQHEWATSLLMCKKYDVYVAMRARIALRKAGILPVVGKTDEEKEKEEKLLIETEILQVKHNQGMPLDREDVVAAFRNGEEVIDIIRMRCVQYDHVFANDMKEKLPRYSSLLAANKRKAALRASNTRKKTLMAKRMDEPHPASQANTLFDSENGAITTHAAVQNKGSTRNIVPPEGNGDGLAKAGGDQFVSAVDDLRDNDEPGFVPQMDPLSDSEDYLKVPALPLFVRNPLSDGEDDLQVPVHPTFGPDSLSDSEDGLQVPTHLNFKSDLSSKDDLQAPTTFKFEPLSDSEDDLQVPATFEPDQLSDSEDDPQVPAHPTFVPHSLSNSEDDLLVPAYPCFIPAVSVLSDGEETSGEVGHLAISI